ncbi:sulfotransferase domain-containing protein [Marinactinospora rubrisoli]|uniref:Sulfotransferase domain-containing protein n=1 Tax=Marinactinospora rubrisoli TaxID=2715399 RepID=A0ABW2KBN3_9ACTN
MSDRSTRPSGGTRSAAQEAARRAADAFGQCTRGLRVLPTFLIAGAQRCGTTSLFKALTQHPAVLGPVLRKGVHYFDVGHHRGLDWYRGHFPLAMRTRRRRGAPPAPVQVGESSPYYLFHPLAAERIARELPEVRVIVTLRDPVQRAYSAHVHERARGFETEPFERALELEQDRLAGTEERLRADPTAVSHSHRHHGYLARGRYAEQLERLEKHLGRDRLYVVDSGDLFTDPEPVFAEVELFLGLPHRPDIRFERHNARPRADMDPALRARLEEYFAPHDERLAAWWGRTPSWRR